MPDRRSEAVRVPRGRQAADAWYALSRRTRRDVRRFARRGRPHPDRNAAVAAVGWARWVRTDVLRTIPIATLFTVAGLVFIAGVFLLPPLLLGAEVALVVVVAGWRIVSRRRLARRVERANLPRIFERP